MEGELGLKLTGTALEDHRRATTLAGDTSLRLGRCARGFYVHRPATFGVKDRAFARPAHLRTPDLSLQLMQDDNNNIGLDESC